MQGELARKNTTLPGRARWLGANPPWQGLALAAVLMLTALLNLYGLTGEGYANSYYAAAVKNMLMSWQNFFFVSFDAGFVSVDKPPLGLWVQAASAWLFGFSGLSILLPQAIAGVISVAVLYHLVRRTFGPVAGLLSALVLALTPIVVATSRNNTMDMLVVLAVLLAAGAFLVAAERGA
jgi:4-amino-4-deoxy-L-arabinose transferase-like glycosyltransferase